MTKRGGYSMSCKAGTREDRDSDSPAHIYAELTFSRLPVDSFIKLIDVVGFRCDCGQEVHGDGVATLNDGSRGDQ